MDGAQASAWLDPNPSWIYLRVACHHKSIRFILVTGDQAKTSWPLNAAVIDFYLSRVGDGLTDVPPDCVPWGLDGNGIGAGSLDYLENNKFKPVFFPARSKVAISIFCFGLPLHHPGTCLSWTGAGSGWSGKSSFGNNSRAELTERGAYFLLDYPITGGGLNSFPGLYSQYMLGIPQFYFINSYNLFLDVAIEQGIIGGLAFLPHLFWGDLACFEDTYRDSGTRGAVSELAKLVRPYFYGCSWFLL